MQPWRNSECVRVLLVLDFSSRSMPRLSPTGTADGGDVGRLISLDDERLSLSIQHRDLPEWCNRAAESGAGHRDGVGR
jgi:hypothetical protein